MAFTCTMIQIGCARNSTSDATMLQRMQKCYADQICNNMLQKHLKLSECGNMLSDGVKRDAV